VCLSGEYGSVNANMSIKALKNPASVTSKTVASCEMMTEKRPPAQSSIEGCAAAIAPRDYDSL
jgi:hypothetical protein